MIKQNFAQLSYQSFHNMCLSDDLQVSSNDIYKSTFASIQQDTASSSIFSTSKHCLVKDNSNGSTSVSSKVHKSSSLPSSSSFTLCSLNDARSPNKIPNALDLKESDNNNSNTTKEKHKDDKTGNLSKDIEKYSLIKLMKESVDAHIVPCISKNGPGQQSDKEKLLIQTNIIKAKNEAATKLAFARSQLKEDRKRLPRNFLRNLLYEINRKYNLEGKHKVQTSTIKSRLKSNRKLIVEQEGNTSPLIKIEKIAVELLIRCGEMNQPLSCEQGLDLIQSLVKNDEMKEEIFSWIKENCHPNSDNEELIGARYWRNFLKRNKDKLRSKRGKLFPQSRDDWCTYENLKEMYHMVYDLLTKAGVAEELDNPQYMDKFGNEANKDSAYGLMVNHEIKHPDYFIHVDEFGDNLDMTKDKAKGGQKFIVGKNQTPNIGVSSNNLHYTVLGFTAANGEPIMCAIIIAKENADEEDGVKLSVVTGIDVLSKELIDINNLQKSFNEGGALSGGPKCNFRGKEVPCYVTTSQKGGMNSKILTALFRYMDEQDLFPRKPNGPLPFVLIDGHGSRFGIEFLSYINDPQHLWYVCLGLPYGTHKWQVADSEEQNGAMRCSIGNIKKKITRETKTGI